MPCLTVFDVSVASLQRKIFHTIWRLLTLQKHARKWHQRQCKRNLEPIEDHRIYSVVDMEDRRLKRQKREATQLLIWHLQTPYLQPETNFSWVVSSSMQKEQLLARSQRQLKQLQSRKRCTKLFLLFGRKKEAWLRRTYSKISQQLIYFPLLGIDDKNGSKHAELIFWLSFTEVACKDNLDGISLNKVFSDISHKLHQVSKW